MKNLKLLILITCLPIGVFAQQLIGFGGNRMTDTAYAARSMRVDSVVRFVRYRTADTNKVVGFDANGVMVLRSKSNTSAFDTTNIYAQLALRVKYSDTATMLANYLNSGDIGVSVQGYNASATILGNTTSGSGSTILLQGSPTITLPNIAAINVSGGILSLPTGASGTLMRLADTSTLSTRINDKLNIADTTVMLSPYLRKVDTTAMLANYYDVRDTGRSNGNIVTGGTLSKVTDSLGALIGGGGVSVASAAELNTGTDNAKFASPLAIEGSKYIDQDGSKIAALTTGTATAYVLNTTPSFTPGTWTMLNVKFHVANTGAATINVNGSGAVALQKDLSTALVANDIPVNSEYQLLRTSTGWLVKDIGFAGVNTSARFFASISDETGGTLVVGSASPTFTGTPAAPTAAAGTNTTQIATTAHVFAERTNTATLTNKTLTSPSIATPLITGLSSGTTNDSILVADPSTGAVRRISSARISGGGGGSGWGLTGNTGLSSTLNWVGNNDDISLNFKVNNVFSGEIAPSAYGRTHFGYNAGAAAKSGLAFYTTLIGSNAGVGITSNGSTGIGEAVFDNAGALSNSVAIGRKAATTLNNGDNNVTIGYFATVPNGSHQLNIQNVLWGIGCDGIYTSATTAKGRIGIGTNAPNASAILDLTSTTQGFLPPRMTGTQAAAIASKAEGLMVYVTDATGGFAAKGWYGWNGAAWEKLNP